MLFQHFNWHLTHQEFFIYVLCSCPSLKLERKALKMHIIWFKTDICSGKISANVSLMLGNPFLVPFLCKFKHISVYFMLNSMKINRPPNSWSPKATLFKVIPWCFEPFDNFQDKTDIYIKTGFVSRLSFFFLWLWWNRKSDFKHLSYSI